MSRSAWWLVALAVAGAVALVHGGTLEGGFVYDDHRFIEHNTSLADVGVLEAFRDPATASAGEGITHDIYRPLRTLLFAAEYRLFAEIKAGGAVDYRLPLWHLVSILLHVINAVLVFRLLMPLLRGVWPAAAAGALLFGVHPLTSESVAWLSSQGDLLAMTFLLSALVVFERRGWGATALGAACFLLACLAKESALMLPFLLPLRDLALPRGSGEAGAPSPSPWGRTTFVRVAVLLGLVGAYFLLRASVLPGLAQVDHAEGSPFATARAMLHGLTWYGQSVLAPFGFTFDTRIDVPARWSDPEVIVGLGLLATLLAATVHGLRTKRYVLVFACLGALVALGPVSNILVPLKTFVADRFFYPALLCVGAGLGALLVWLGGASRAAAYTIVAGLLVVCGVLTMERNEAWASEQALWQAVRADRPWNANAYQGIAFEAARAKQVDVAENAYATYLEANAFDAKSIYTMGTLFGELAEGLVVVGPVGPGEEITTPIRRKQARVAQINLYRRAYEIWSRPGGLSLGRGSSELVIDMLNRWIEAGTDLGDLATAKFANDRAIEWESNGAIDPRRPADVQAKASWARRRIRAELAIRAVKAHADREVPRGMRAEVTRLRAVLLQDAALDPNKSDKALRHDFIELLLQLEAEAMGRGEFLPDEHLFLEQAALLLGTGQRDKAIAVLKRGIRILGKPATALRANLDALLAGPPRRGAGPGGRRRK